jgi:cyclopropane fatty-acyl-phospholipid synthase-like methyltransferase
MNTLTEEQNRQEAQYTFPYHYVSSFRSGFSCALFDAYGINYMSVIEHILGHLDRIPFDSVCDVGTGDGRFVRELAYRYPHRKVCGIDYSNRAIAMTRALNPRLDFLCADITRDAIPRRFDVITLIEVFEHIPFDRTCAFVQSLSGLLNERGYLLLTVPHKNVTVSKKHVQHFSSDGLKVCFDPFFEVINEAFLERRWYLRKLIREFLKNKLFILNNRFLLNRLYSLYKRTCLLASEKTCSRIFLLLQRRNGASRPDEPLRQHG